MLIKVSVKTLAEFVHRRGDLYPALGGRVSGEEGINTQRRVQQDRGAGYEREVTVADSFVRDDLDIGVSGRVDGCDFTAEPPLVEEIKTTRADPADAQRLVGSAHWAQATLYAALLARTHPEHDTWQVRLLYCHPDNHNAMPFDRTLSAEALQDYLQQTLAAYGSWVQEQLSYRQARNAWLAERSFPYGGFRPHQRALAGRVYRAFQAGEHLLLEAPTGSGKTMGVMYPALKALAAGHIERIFFLTSRGTGAIAATQAARDLATASQQIRVVDLIAKEKACPVAGMPCDDSCPFAVGYFDRIQDALRALLAHRQMDPATVQSVAELHQVCPFELSLDAALWADLVIGDYNYLLDPVVRLQRFADDGTMGLLVDESHQLADRTRDMLSLSLDRQTVRAALKESPPDALQRRIRSLDRSLMSLRRELCTAPAEALTEVVIPEPASLLKAMQRTLDALAKGGEGGDPVDLGRYPATQLLMFNLSRWLRSSSWTDAERFRYFGMVSSGGRGAREVKVSLACLDPAGYLADVLAGYGPHVRFSGTVSPLALYQALHGQGTVNGENRENGEDGEDGENGANDANGKPVAAAERVESPFRPEQLATLIVNDLPVYYRQRERTLPRLADLVAGICAVRAGNYLVALPSFDYLDRLADQLRERHPLLTIQSQQPGMSEAARAEFLRGFERLTGPENLRGSEQKAATRIGLIVLGGVFGESVDFSHAPLAGVICVGVGLPPASALRREMATHYDATLGPGSGETVAYQQPAMTKVLQMAGRLLRSPADLGVLCLIDDRFSRKEYARFFPRHWHPEIMSAEQVTGRLENFWQVAAGLPRLPTTV